MASINNKKQAEIMTNTYYFYTKKNNSSKFHTNNTNYSKILDDIIAADIIDKNPYLFDYNKTAEDNLIDSLIGTKYTTFTSSTLKDNNDFIIAANFLANYKKNKTTYKIPYIIGKMYTLSDGTPIIFYDDEIQIGFDTFKYSKFADLSFLNNLKPTTKKTIINIYTFGNSNININLL